MIYRVTTNYAPIKNSITSSGQIIDRLSINTEIDIKEIVNKKWAKFIYNNEDVYMHLMYLAYVKERVEEPIKSIDENKTKDTEEESVDVVSEENYEEILGKIIIKYIDYNTKEDIKEEKIYENLDLGSYILNYDNIDGYIGVGNNFKEALISIENCEKTVYFEYEKIFGNITIKYVDDISRAEIMLKEEMKNLELGAYEFNFKEIEGYTLIGLDNKKIVLDEIINKYTVYFIYKENK